MIADEAHRSQYDLIDGLARHMRDALPNASFIGFTSTPIEKTDANTRAVFGDYIFIYDIQRCSPTRRVPYSPPEIGNGEDTDQASNSGTTTPPRTMSIGRLPGAIRRLSELMPRQR